MSFKVLLKKKRHMDGGRATTEGQRHEKFAVSRTKGMKEKKCSCDVMMGG